MGDLILLFPRQCVFKVMSLETYSDRFNIHGQCYNLIGAIYSTIAEKNHDHRVKTKTRLLALDCFNATMDRLHNRQNFQKSRNSTIHSNSVKEHPKISRNAKFGSEMF